MHRLIPKGRIGFALLTAALAVGFQFFFAGEALAHHVTIQASAVCSDSSGAVINYTVGSWDPGVPGSNPQVDIKVNGFVVASIEFVVPNDPVSGSTPAPSGTSATVEAVVVGTWGDGQPGVESAGTTVTIPTNCGPTTTGEGRFTGGGYQILAPIGLSRSADGVAKTVSGGIKITRGFTIHCDLKLSNNLEVNWEGNHFHMLEHLLTTECSDSPEITQRPPRAPVDTIKGIGTGRYNGVDGYTIEFTLVDAGEPGKAAQPDQAALKIYQGTPANPGVVVLEVPLQDIGGGNVQAHYDQPHGSNGNK